MFATIFCGVLNIGTGKFVYSDGGHCKPYIMHKEGEIEPLPVLKGLPLGVLEEKVYENNRLNLQRGDRILLYTDGITEAETLDHAQYGSTRLLNYVKQAADGSSERFIEGLLRDVEHFSQDAPQSDDIAVLVVKM